MLVRTQRRTLSKIHALPILGDAGKITVERTIFAVDCGKLHAVVAR